MVSIGRKGAPFLVATVAALLLALPASATTQEEEGDNHAGSGTFAELQFVGTGPTVSQPNGSTFLSQTTTGQFSGTISATFTETVAIAIFADGSLRFSGFDSVSGTVAGRAGTFVDRLDGSGMAGATSISANGRLIVLRGTGELSNLRAVVKVTATVNPTTGLAAGSYSVEYGFES